MAFLQKAFGRLLRLVGFTAIPEPELSKKPEYYAGMMAYFANTSSMSYSSIQKFSPRMEKIFSSSVKKTYDDLFACIAADVSANSRYSSLLARGLLSTDPEQESRLASETQMSAESHVARNCLLTMLDNLRQQDLMNLLSCFLAHNPEALKVLFRGGPSSIETLSMENTKISFPNMLATIADEYESQQQAGKEDKRLTRMQLKSHFTLQSLLVNVSDLEKETLKVFICVNLLVVIGKVTTPSRYGQVEKEIIKLPNVKYDFKRATAEIMEEGELRICYPIIYEQEEKRPMCMQVKLKQIGD